MQPARAIVTGLCLSGLLLAFRGVADAQPGPVDPSLFRIFLKDGTTLASYGEFARVGERVVFTLPLGAARQRLASVGVSEVDWPRTDGYAHAVRAVHYASTRGEAEFSAMSSRVAGTLTEIARTPDPVDQLRRAEDARRELAAWPDTHFGYKAGEIRETLSVLDEVIAGLRAKTSATRFDLSLVAGATTPPAVPLLGAPTLQDSIEQALRLSAAADSSAERVELLRDAIAAIDEAPGLASGAATAALTAGTATTTGAATTGTATTKMATTGTATNGAGTNEASAAWVRDTRRRLSDMIEVETTIDRDYAELAVATLAASTKRVRRADVRGLTRLRADVLSRDTKLGGKRPQQLQALLATLDQRLDAAQRLRLARDQWTVKSRAYRTYRDAISSPLDLLRRAEPALNDIRSLAGPSSDVLVDLAKRFDRLRDLVRRLGVPIDLQGAHASLVSAFQLAEAAVRQRQRAIAQNDMDLARNASAAAAGSLMLAERVQTEVARLLEPPQEMSRLP